MMKACVIGCGMIARSAHIPALQSFERVTVAAVADADIEAARRTAAEFHIPRYYGDAEEMLSKEKPEIVSVCVPNFLHKPCTLAALAHGANVLCEKPLAFSLADAQELFGFAKQQKRVLMACQTLRFLPERLAAARLVREGAIGKIYYAEVSRIRRRGIPTWGKFHLASHSGGGALVDIGVHGLDSALWLMGNPRPVSVTASMAKVHADELSSPERAGAFKGNVSTATFDPKEMDVESFSSGIVTFSNGASLSFRVAWAANLPEENTIVLAGEQCGIDLEKRKVYRGPDEIAELPVTPNGFTSEPFYGHYCLVNNLLDVLEGKAEPFVKPEETLNVTAVLEAAYRSAREGKAVTIG